MLATNGKSKLRIDFYLPELLIAIEFDGEQHFSFCEKWHRSVDDWKRQWDNDRLKDFYCITRGIKMVRIHHKDLKKIEAILDIEIE